MDGETFLDCVLAGTAVSSYASGGLSNESSTWSATSGRVLPLRRRLDAEERLMLLKAQLRAIRSRSGSSTMASQHIPGAEGEEEAVVRKSREKWLSRYAAALDEVEQTARCSIAKAELRQRATITGTAHEVLQREMKRIAERRMLDVTGRASTSRLHSPASTAFLLVNSRTNSEIRRSTHPADYVYGTRRPHTRPLYDIHLREHYTL